MKYILTTVSSFYEVFNTQTKTTVYATDSRAKAVDIVNKLNLGKTTEDKLK